MMRIANFSGYWGDDPDALIQQLEGGAVDYVVGDYLAELTMAILERQRRVDPKRGYAHHFVEHLRAALPALVKRGARIIVNAGGTNPEACRAAVSRVLEEAGVSLPIGLVLGSDLTAALPELRAQGVSLANADTKETFEVIAARLLNAHAYLGARPIAKALDLGARVVITGRVTDAALALGPMIHAFGWPEDDWDKLAAGTIAGHLLECGAQATGGVFTDFESIELGPKGTRIGYPIVEIDERGDFVVTKHEGTGGRVTVETIAEQLLYEIGDPRRYLSPDVTADFSAVTLDEIGRDRIRVRGARGAPPPAELKVSCTFDAGHRAFAHVLIAGPRIREKAKRFRDLLESAFKKGFVDSRFDLIGLGALLPTPQAATSPEPSEAILRIAVRDHDRAKVERFVRLLLGIWVQGPPGVTLFSGAPHAEEAFGFWPALVPRERVIAEVVVAGEGKVERIEVPLGAPPRQGRAMVGEAPPLLLAPAPISTKRVRLRALAHARSGDKGDRANVGVRARSDRAFDYLRAVLTEARVQKHFASVVKGPVIRYDLPKIRAFNFVFEHALGGGGSISLRPDPLGKTFSDLFLEMELDAPDDLVSRS